MKGIFLSSFYTAKKSLITYFIVSIVATVIFAFINPTMACFMPMIFLISPVTDNMKHEKDSRWMYYVSTLPAHRDAYVKSYFAFYGLLIALGLIIGIIVTAIITRSFDIVVISAFIGIGAAGTYAIMFPLTFKFGPENSNVIMITTTIIMLALFFLFYVAFAYIALSGSDSLLNAKLTGPTLATLGGYGLLGIILFVVSYFISLSIFRKQEL